jgi:hypothetical protein
MGREGVGRYSLGGIMLRHVVGSRYPSDDENEHKD